MDIGTMHIQPDSAADPAQVARHAEALGFESYWVADHTILPVTFSDTYPGVAAGQVPPDSARQCQQNSRAFRRIAEWGMAGFLW